MVELFFIINFDGLFTDKKRTSRQLYGYLWVMGSSRVMATATSRGN